MHPATGVRRTGTIAWGLGFLAYIPIPIGNVLVTGITQLVVGLRQRRYGGVAAANGVRAANWGLTQLCHPVLLAVAMVIGVLTGTPSDTGGYTMQPWAEAIVFTILGLWFVLGVLQLIYALVGTSVAGKGNRVRLPVIPFIRLRRPDPDGMTSGAPGASDRPPHGTAWRSTADR